MLAGKTFSILGDSYSTFRGFIPEGYDCYYPSPQSVSDVLAVEDTWWRKLIRLEGMELLVNNSYSGSTVCTQVREHHPASASFVARAECDFCDDGGNSPDYLFVFGSTNDSWIEREIGQVQFEGRTQKDLRKVLPAFCHVLERLGVKYPETRLVAVINTGLNPAIGEGLLLAAAHYGAIPIQLENIDKQNGHPTALGMGQIARQIGSKLK